MQWANRDNLRVEATPSARATCPACGTPVLAKCGEIVMWHWAHEVAECDPWYEPESQWHRDWKSLFPQEWQEVVIGPHRADVKTPLLVVEFQASNISSEDIREREEFYRNMVWVLRGEDFADNLNIRTKEGHVTFRWKWPRKTWWSAKSPLYIDLPRGILHIKKIYQNTPCGGWGVWIEKADFVRCCGYLSGTLFGAI